LVLFRVQGSGPIYQKAFDGECGGEELLMFEGDGDNEGTVEERTHNCAVACESKQTPLTGSWSGFEAKGFVINLESSGRCFCESAESATCSRVENGYERYDWTPGVPGVLCRTPKAPDANGNGITPDQSAATGSTLHSYALDNIWHPENCSSVGSMCYPKALTKQYYEIELDELGQGKRCVMFDIDHSKRDMEPADAPVRASRYCRHASSFSPGASYTVKEKCEISLCYNYNTEVNIDTGESRYFLFDDVWYITNELKYTFSVSKQTLCQVDALPSSCRVERQCTIKQLELQSVSSGVCEIYRTESTNEYCSSNCRDGIATCPSFITDANNLVVTNPSHINAIADKKIFQQVCGAA
jgi:hypothetical protein